MALEGIWVSCPTLTDMHTVDIFNNTPGRVGFGMGWATLQVNSKEISLAKPLWVKLAHAIIEQDMRDKLMEAEDGGG